MERLFQGVEAAIVAGLFVVIGKVIEWLIGRRSTTSKVKIDETAAEDDHSDDVITRYRQLWQDERTRAENMAKDHGAITTELNQRISDLEAENERLRHEMREMDQTISRQARRIERLERQIQQLTGNSEGL